MQGEAHASIICNASYETASAIVRRFASVDLWASDLVECCVVENGADDTTTGCARRIVIKGQTAPLRETLVGCRASEYETFLTSQFTDAYTAELNSGSLRAKKAQFDAELAGRVNAVPTVSCPLTKASNFVTTLRVTRISNTDLKCFVEYHTTFDAPTPTQVEAARTFFSSWGSNTVNALSNYLLNVVFPAFTPARPPHLEKFEDVVVRALVRDPTLSDLETLLEGYRTAYAARDVAEQTVLRLRDELQARDLLLASSANTVSALAQENARLELQSLLAKHSSVSDDPPVPQEEINVEPAVHQLAPRSEDGSPPIERAAAADSHVKSVPTKSAPTPFLPDASVQREFDKFDVEKRGFLLVSEMSRAFQLFDNCTDKDIELRAGKPTTREEMYQRQASQWIKRHARDRERVYQDEFALFLCQTIKN